MSKVGLTPTQTIGLPLVDGVANPATVGPSFEVGLGESPSVHRNPGAFLGGSRSVLVGAMLLGAFFLCRTDQASAQMAAAGPAQGQIERTQGQPRLQSVVITQSESNVRLDDPTALTLIAGPEGTWNAAAKIPLASLDSTLRAALEARIPIQDAQAFGPWGQRGETTAMTFKVENGTLLVLGNDVEPGMWRKVPPRIIVQLANGEFHMVVLTAPQLTRDFTAMRRASAEAQIPGLKEAITTLERELAATTSPTNQQLLAELKASLAKAESELKGPIPGASTVIASEHLR